MKITINENYFVNTFKNENSDYKNNFSYSGLKALFNYLEDLEEELNEEFTFDYIAIACDYTEWKNFAEFQEQYPDIESENDISEHTTYIPFKVFGVTKFITQNF